MDFSQDVVFGPVPSRRLGQSLGINNIPPKICTYGCVYCQLGRTLKMRHERAAYYDPQELVDIINKKAEQTIQLGQAIDYLAFVPDGEPTLDINLGKTVRLLKDSAFPVAVISNASLIGREDVQDDLLAADWVSLKMDAVSDETWRSVDRPHHRLKLESILNGALQFRKKFSGTLVTETMLIDGLNDQLHSLHDTAAYLRQLQPDIAYISIPTRPPAEPWVKPAAEHSLNLAYQLFTAQLPQVELLIGYEGNAFAASGDAQQDILSITAVHPMRRDAVQELLKKEGAEWSVVEQLLEQGKLVDERFEGHQFYLRSFSKKQDAGY